MTEKRIHDPIGAAAAFVHDHERRFRPLYVEAASAAWDLATTGLPEHADRKTAAEVEIGRIFADLGAYTRVNSFDRVLREHAEVDPLLRRQVHLLRLAYLEGQIDDTTLAERVVLETEIENEFNHHRGRLRGEHVDDNELRRVLLGEDDVALRRDAWLASKEVGAHVAARLERLVRIRNTAARRRGFRDHRLVRMPQAPRAIHVDLVRSAAPPAGVGEPGVPPVAPALANAVFALTGVRVRRLPVLRRGVFPG